MTEYLTSPYFWFWVYVIGLAPFIIWYFTHLVQEESDVTLGMFVGIVIVSLTPFLREAVLIAYSNITQKVLFEARKPQPVPLPFNHNRRPSASTKPQPPPKKP